MKYGYYINLDERGEFFADVREADEDGDSDNGKTVLAIHGYEIIEEGFMRHKRDVAGLLDHMISLDIAQKGDTLTHRQ